MDELMNEAWVSLTPRIRHYGYRLVILKLNAINDFSTCFSTHTGAMHIWWYGTNSYAYSLNSGVSYLDMLAFSHHIIVVISHLQL